ncbi:hypothetical protein AUO94_03905 [Planococcus kocurii]|uniref:Uncharacterized protein n=1 Tax=Planococcus kocurii TaxID=1374 RepID=A0ABM5WU30_9BACL|nr:hypothetical protein AUO94_03905 [Planococcus kocurii]
MFCTTLSKKSACSFCGVLEVAFERLGHGSRTKPRKALVLVLRLARDAPQLGVGGDSAQILCLGMGVGVKFWSRLAAEVHAPSLLG